MNLLHNEIFLKRMQQRVADGSITASTMRNMGPAQTIEAVRKFLRNPELLRAFGSVGSESAFMALLDEQTECLRENLLDGPRMRKEKYVGLWEKRWGVARKCLNIFLYECLNNRWLCEAYPRLCDLEPWLEVPLDSYVGFALDKAGKHQKTPGWKSVIRLTEAESRIYQAFASEFAKENSSHRVHLDLVFYNERKSE